MYKDWSLYGHPVMVDWEDRGYFAYLDTALPVQTNAARGTPEGHYSQWLDALRCARQGDFSRIPPLVTICASDTHPVCRRLSAELIGDAGPGACVDAVAHRLAGGTDNFEVTLSWCRVLLRRARLADIAVVLDAYERVATVPDAGIIPVLISDCLETDSDLSDAEEFDSLSSYRSAVQERCRELVDRWGSDQVMVFGGEPAGVRQLAQKMLDRLREPDFPAEMRRRFEVATGIDCTSFYHDGALQPLQAAALLEAFLEDKNAQRFEDNVRYFFGHPIPAQ